MIRVEQSADLELTTPMEMCCNCGRRPAPPEELQLVATPLKRTRYFLFAGTELTLNETFPYCGACRRSARRIRLGWMGKTLAAALWCSVIFLVLVLAGPALSLPLVVADHLFAASAILAVLVTATYFAYRARDGGERSYYQPVSLAEVALGDGFVGHVKLRAWNPKYAQLLARANVERIRAGMLSIVDRDGKEYASPAISRKPR